MTTFRLTVFSCSVVMIAFAGAAAAATTKDT